MNTMSTMDNKMNTLVLHLVTLFKSYLPTAKREEGQGMVEYALIIALVAILLVAGLGFVQGGIGGVFTAIQTALNAASN